MMFRKREQPDAAVAVVEDDRTAEPTREEAALAEAVRLEGLIAPMRERLAQCRGLANGSPPYSEVREGLKGQALTPETGLRMIEDWSRRRREAIDLLGPLEHLVAEFEAERSHLLDTATYASAKGCNYAGQLDELYLRIDGLNRESMASDWLPEGERRSARALWERVENLEQAMARETRKIKPTRQRPVRMIRPTINKENAA